MALNTNFDTSLVILILAPAFLAKNHRKHATTIYDEICKDIMADSVNFNYATITSLRKTCFHSKIDNHSINVITSL